MERTRIYMAGPHPLDPDTPDARAIVYPRPGYDMGGQIENAPYILDRGPFMGPRFLLVLGNRDWLSDDLPDLESRLCESIAAGEADPVALPVPGLTEGPALDSFVRDYCAAWGFPFDGPVMQSDDVGGVFGVIFSGATRWDFADAIRQADSALGYMLRTFAESRLAPAFASAIRAALTADEVAEVDRRNRQPARAGTCATHDFADSNLIMSRVFETVTGRPMDGESGHDLRLWGMAWDAAREKGFAGGPPPSSMFWDWFDSAEAARAENLRWLDENAPKHGLPTGWRLYHSGGGCTHYRAEGEYQGRRAEFLLCSGSVAEVEWHQPGEPDWLLSATVLDDEGEPVESAVLAECLDDGRDAIRKADLSAPLKPY